MVAASSKSEAGQAASLALIRLDLPDNPHKYLQLELSRDRSNYLLAQITNRTEHSVEDVVFMIQFKDIHAKIREVQLQLPNQLGAHQKTIIATGIGPFTDLRKVQGKVIQARIVED